jgi:hypothetical protein
MKTILIVLGSLFVLSRLNGGSGLTLTLGGNAAPGAAPFSPTPAAGGAATLIPPGGNDPYANLPGGGGGAGVPGVANGGAVGGGTGSGFHGIYSVSPVPFRSPGGAINSRVVRTGVRTA